MTIAIVDASIFAVLINLVARSNVIGVDGVHESLEFANGCQLLQCESPEQALS